MSVLAAMSSVNIYVVYLDDSHIGDMCTHNRVDPCWINSSSLHNVLCSLQFSTDAVLCCDEGPTTSLLETMCKHLHSTLRVCFYG